MSEYYLLIHGDARRLPVDPREIDAVVSDPPYGMGWNTNSKRFTGRHQKQGAGRNDWGAIANDDKPFDPSPWLGYRKVLLFGANHYAARLPVGTLLVWIKRNDDTFGTFLSDAEVAWMKGGHGVYCFRSLEMFVINHNRIHPSQKPISVMRWCIQKLKLQPGSLVLDPYMGSCSTGLAALAEGHRFIGIDCDRKWVNKASRRLEHPTLRFNALARQSITRCLEISREPSLQASHREMAPSQADTTHARPLANQGPDQAWRSQFGLHCAIQFRIPVATTKRRVDLHITLGPRQREGDDDNWWKSVLDALVHAKMLIDDNRRWCEYGTPTFDRGPEKATVITLTDI